MRFGFGRAALAGLGLLAALLAAPVARACSVCLAGDPLYDTNGTTAQAKGSFNAHLMVRGWSKSSGLLPHVDPTPAPDPAPPPPTRRHAFHPGHTPTGDADDGTEFNDSQQIDLFLSYTPIDRLTLTLDLPWRFTEIVAEQGGQTASAQLDGFGDLSIAATGVLWRNRPILPSTWVEARAFLKFPTGESEKEVNGLLDPHLQPGTGSWDFAFGAAVVHKLNWAILYASTSYRVNTLGSLDYEYGDVFLFNGAIDVPLGKALGASWLRRVTANLQLNVRWADFDQSRGVDWEDSGGWIPYLTPGVAIALPWFENRRPPAIRAFGQIPLTQAGLNGRQNEDPLWGVGLQMGF